VFIVNEREWRWVMKKLLLMIIALSFIAVVPKVASAFTVFEFADVSISQISWAGGVSKLDIKLSQAEGGTDITGIEASNYAMNSLAAGLSLKDKRFIHCSTQDLNNDGVLEISAFAVGNNSLPGY